MLNVNNDYAEVIVEVPNRQLDRPFHYLVPSHLRPLPVGSRVLVSFGARTVPGYVLGYSTPPSGITIKSIKKVLGDSLNQELIELARWMSHKYLCTLSESLQCVLGPGREPRKVAKGLYAKVNSVKFAKTPLTAKQQIVLETAIANAGLSKAKLARVAGVSTATVDALIKKKITFLVYPRRNGK